MRQPGTRPIIVGFILAIGITLTLPYFAFAAGRSFGGSGKFKAPRIHRTFGAAHSFSSVSFKAPSIHRQQSFLRPFHDFNSSGRFRADRFHRQDFFSHPFNGFGFVGGVSGFSEQPVIIIQQFQPTPNIEPREPAANRVYVQPRWVDGGHGVQVLQPGYWTDAKQAGR
jgi:hypothetical protein